MATIIGSTNNNLWTYKLEVSESVPSDASTSNVSSVIVDIYIGRASSRSYIGGGWTGTVTVDGNTNNVSGTIPYPTYIDGGAWYQIGSTTFPSIRHNDDGSKTVAVSATMSSSAFTPSYCSASGNVTLTTIPRYFSSTPKLELVSKTTKTVTLKWTTSENASRSQYKIGDGSWVDVETGINKKTGTMTISGLTANTSYRIYGDFMRADSGLWAQTKPYIDVKTYDYAKISSAPDFNDENSPKITYTNPLGNAATTLQARIENSNGTSAYVEYRNINKTGTLSYTFNFTTAERNTLRSACSDSNSLVVKFVIKTVVDGTTYWSTVNKTMSIVNGNPTFTNFTYQDTNTTVSNLIGTNQALVKGKSNLQVTIPSANKMVANKQATPKNYTFTFGSINKTKDYLTNDLTVDMGLIKTVGTQKLTVRAFDSRTNSTAVEKNIVVYDYKEPVINATVKRLNNFENQTTLSVSGEFSKLIVDNVAKNTVSSFRYRYKETTSSNWEDWSSLTTTIGDGTFTCEDVYLVLDNTKSFNFEIEVVDNLSTVTLPLTLDVGQAIFFISSNLSACFVDGYLDVSGDIKQNGVSIIESGSNNNGYYIKYANGVLMQWGESYFGSSGSTNDSYKTVFFPVSFIDSNYSMIAQARYVSGSTMPQTHSLGTLLTPSIGSASNNDVYRRLSYLSPGNSGQTALYSMAQPFYWQAMGRWK